MPQITATPDPANTEGTALHDVSHELASDDPDTIGTARRLAAELRREHHTDGRDEVITDLLAIIDRQATVLRATADKVDGQWTRLTGIDPAELRCVAAGILPPPKESDR